MVQFFVSASGTKIRSRYFFSIFCWNPFSGSPREAAAHWADLPNERNQEILCHLSIQFAFDGDGNGDVGVSTGVGIGVISLAPSNAIQT